MIARDPYDPMVAFDDLRPAHQDAGDRAEKAKRVLRQLKRGRLSSVPVRVQCLGYDYTPWSFTILGADDADRKATGLPLLDAIADRFAAATPPPRAVRLDTEESYRAFREARREPYVKQLGERLAELERRVAEHVADNHADGRLDRLEHELREHVRVDDERLEQLERNVLRQVVVGWEPLPLPLPEAETGAISSWQDGGEILCTIRLPGALLATSATPVSRHLEEVVGCADHVLGADGDIEDVAFLVPLVPLIGAVALVSELCGAVPQLVRHEAPFVGAIVPQLDPTMAGVIALLQRCQQGDKRACAEASVLAEKRKDLFQEALARLLRGQRDKANGRSL
jgi:hypothetical protein